MGPLLGLVAVDDANFDRGIKLRSRGHGAGGIGVVDRVGWDGAEAFTKAVGGCGWVHVADFGGGEYGGEH